MLIEGYLVASEGPSGRGLAVVLFGDADQLAVFYSAWKSLPAEVPW